MAYFKFRDHFADERRLEVFSIVNYNGKSVHQMNE